jgi:hypothetical protein
MKSSPEWMKSSREVRASHCQCQSRDSPGFDPIYIFASQVREKLTEFKISHIARSVWVTDK